MNKWWCNHQFDYRTAISHFDDRQFVYSKDNGDKLIAIIFVYGCMMPHQSSCDPGKKSSDGTINMCKNEPDMIFPRSFFSNALQTYI